jgi:hypothetical protein
VKALRHRTDHRSRKERRPSRAKSPSRNQRRCVRSTPSLAEAFFVLLFGAPRVRSFTININAHRRRERPLI